MSKTVLITGATSGIGNELVQLFAYDKNDLVLVARNLDNLNKLKEELEGKFGINVKVMSKDLIKQSSAYEIVEELEKEGISIDVLVNNAGFGDYGIFATSDLGKQESMIDLNIKTLTTLTRLLLPDMMIKQEGQILNVASIAAFSPGPYMSVYYATKAFVLSFTESIAYELKDFNIKVTALCPPPTKTNFASTAGEGASVFFDIFGMATPDQVAKYGYDSLQKNKTIALYGFKNKALVFFARFMPRKAVTWLVGQIQKER